jgi:hypothetical protein
MPHTLPTSLRLSIDYLTIIQRELDKPEPDQDVLVRFTALALTHAKRAQSANNLVNAAGRTYDPNAESGCEGLPPTFGHVLEAMKRRNQ